MAINSKPVKSEKGAFYYVNTYPGANAYGEHWRITYDNGQSTEWHDATTHFCWFVAESVSYSNSIITVNWRLGVSYTDKNEGGHNIARMEAWINGSSVANVQGSNGWWYGGNKEWQKGPDSYTIATGTTKINWNGQPTQQFSMNVKGFYNWGYADNRWTSTSIAYDKNEASYTYTVTGLPAYPTINYINISDVNHEVAYLSASVSNPAGSITSYSWSITPNSKWFALEDLMKAQRYAQGLDETTEEAISKYDLNRNYIIDDEDLAVIQNNLYGQSMSSSSGYIYNLTPNTTYSVTLTVTNSYGYSDTYYGSFTTTGRAPWLRQWVWNYGRTEFSYLTDHEDFWIQYDPWDGEYYGSYETWYGPEDEGYAYYHQGFSLTNLEPNTKYIYNFTITGIQGYSTDKIYAEFETSCYAPYNMRMSFVRNGWDYITLRMNAEGDTNAPILAYEIWYIQDGETKMRYLGSSNEESISGLQPDTNYTIWFEAYNDGGWSRSEEFTFSTAMPNIEDYDIVCKELTPFSVTYAIENCVINPPREFRYAFSKDGGATYTPYQVSNTYTWDNLTEETEYSMCAKVKALHQGVNSSDKASQSAWSLTTPADQAKIWVKTQEGWKKGKVWFKQDDSTWAKAKKIFYKQNDTTWTRGINGEN